MKKSSPCPCLVGLCIFAFGLGVNPTCTVCQEAAGSNQAEKSKSEAESKPPIVLSETTVVTANVSYVEGADPLRTLDIYAPKGASGAPVVIFIHGGGWSKRDKDEVGSQPKLFNSAGIIVASINYRLAPAIRHPENVRDVAFAIAWIHRNIRKSGGDPNKIFLMGHSAGSHLAALVATDERYLAENDLRRNQLAGVISLDGSAFDILDRVKNGSAQIAENCRRAFGESHVAQADGSPINHLKGSDPLPPFLLIYLKDGTLNHTQSQRFMDALEKEKGTAKLIRVMEDKTHQALCDDLGTGQDATGAILVKYIKPN